MGLVVKYGPTGANVYTVMQVVVAMNSRVTSHSVCLHGLPTAACSTLADEDPRRRSIAPHTPRTGRCAPACGGLDRSVETNAAQRSAAPCPTTKTTSTTPADETPQMDIFTV